jgi:ATP synthase protein I
LRALPEGESFKSFAGGSTMNEREDDSLKGLGEQIDRARGARPTVPNAAPSNDGTASALAFGWRVGLELIIAILVAVGIGWAFDRWLGTRPWGIIIFFFLGIATGMVNVWRAVSGLGMAVGYRRGQPNPVVGKDEDDD